ncbi:response regulator transcription factor [Streptomyces thermoviolaceus]|uniref:Response regulator transcription factor n=1 Tax=Streptomyces thermoviolaceus subsp. thermoviolaceus TaxID=66860 RepID=A0ABX0YVA6_STRTL|nr:response regulator transcription factor [Streptomyces thermoviolaceus]MCM3262850.1 response regulator transcription factor [Streptomyces thermoviolaceus]NJP15952.1 response regulator transcription factor [Streptomyces thermoviolaceus subsp. thermoviolaceus]GHA96995.1 DNA-binding response regulator [Streptomyces thermoviolaceus subsp. thermoviolaceus]
MQGPPPPPPAALRVVVADDNPVVSAGLTALLDVRPDIEVVAQAADGTEALQAAAQHRPDVILLDVRMPGLDGLAALPHLVRHAPVLMLTYSRESRIVQECLRRGASGYLVHGEFTADQLAAAVRGVHQGGAHFTSTAAGALGLGAPRARTPRTATPGCGDGPLRPPPPHPRTTTSTTPEWGPARPAAVDRDKFRLSAREAEIMDLIASGMTNRQIAAACFISEKTVKNHINRIFAKLHSTSRAEAAAKWLGTAPDGASQGRGDE